MVPRARLRTRPLANEPLHRCGAGREKEGEGGARELAPGASADGRVRACVRAAAAGSPSGRWSSAVGRRARSGWPERGRVGRVAPRLPHHTGPPAPWRPPWGNTVPAPEPYGRPRRLPPVTTPAYPRPSWCSPARPPRHVPRGLGPKVPGGGARAPPRRASVSGHAPPFATVPSTEPSVRLGMGGVAVVKKKKKKLFIFLLFHDINSCTVLSCSVHVRSKLNPVLKHFSTRRAGGR